MAAGNSQDLVESPAEDIWQPRPDDLTHSNVVKLIQVLGVRDYDALYRLSIEQPDKYWDAVNKYCEMVWAKDYASFVDVSRGKEFPRWFVGGEFNWTDTIFARAKAGRACILAHHSVTRGWCFSDT